MGIGSKVGVWLRRPAGELPGGWLAALVYAGFVVLHVFLACAIPAWIDVDELQYGDTAVVIIDGLGDELEWKRSRGREGFPAVFGRLVVPFFVVFGPTLLALRVAFVFFAGAWAVAWAAVARRMAPSAPLWAVAGSFILPTPFISRYAASPTGMSVHLGVSTAHGIAVLLLLGAWRAAGALRWGLLLAAGLVTGLGVLGGPLMLVLVPGVMLGAALVARWRGLLVVVLGMVPGLAAALSLAPPLASGSSRVGAIGWLIPAHVWQPADALRTWEALLYAPGYVPPDGWTGNYLPVGLLYFGFIAAVYAWGWRVGHRQRAPLFTALLASAGMLLVSVAWVWFTPYGTNRVLGWDAIRYTAPILPVAVIALLVGVSRLRLAGRSGAGFLALAFLAAHAVGIAGHAMPPSDLRPPISTRQIRGHTGLFEFLSFPLRELPDTPRRMAYAMKQGMRATLQAAHVTRARVSIDAPDEAFAWDQVLAHEPAVAAEDRQRREFWRGVGRQIFSLRALGFEAVEVPPEFAAVVQAAIWEGVGMQAHECGFGIEASECRPEAMSRLLPRTAEERAAYAWGWGRACHRDDHVAPVSPPLEIDYEDGRRRRWEIDLAAPGAEFPSDEALRELIYVRWRP